MARRTTTTTTSRTSRTTTRAAAGEPVDDAVVDESGGMGLSDALVFVTTALLVVAILLTDYHMGKHLGTGMFFK